MVTVEILESKVAQYNVLTGLEATLVHYVRSSAPYALQTNDQVFVSGSKNDIYMYLHGAINAICVFAAAHDIKLV